MRDWQHAAATTASRKLIVRRMTGFLPLLRTCGGQVSLRGDQMQCRGRAKSFAY